MWFIFRRLTLATLRDLGFGKSTTEPHIMEEIHHFKNKLKSFNGKPVNLNEQLKLVTLNIIYAVMTGVRFEYTDPQLLRLIDLFNEQLRAISYGSIDAFLPAFMQKPKLLKFLRIPSQLSAGLDILQEFNQIIDKYEKLYVSGNTDTFINAWFTEMEKVPNHQYINKIQLPAVVRDLTMAATDTTANTISWLLLYMVKHPDIQVKVQQEIDEVIGHERMPSMKDLKDMPYTEATLNEGSRISSVVPLSIPHSTVTDTTVYGYNLPKDTMTFVNLWGVMHDPKTFPDPMEFKPERFLTDSKQVKKFEELIPFSMGKRQCMGEPLARMDIFLIFTSLLQEFDFKKVDGAELNFDYKYALVLMPDYQELRAIPRVL